MSRETDKDKQPGLELQDVQDWETKPSTSLLQKPCSTTEESELDNYGESSATQDNDLGKASAKQSEIYRQVPPDPPLPIFVHVNYGKKIPQTKLKRSLTYTETVTRVSTENREMNEQSVHDPTRKLLSNQGTTKQHHANKRMKISISNPEIISHAASTQMANVRRSSIIDMFRLNTPSSSISGYANHANTDNNQIEIQWLTQEEDSQNNHIASNNGESCKLRICHLCDGMGKLPMAGKSDKSTQCPDQNANVRQHLPKHRKPPERRHSTGNLLGIDSAIMTAMIERAEARQFQPPTQSTAVKCIQYFLAFLYYVGMSPIKPASAKQLPQWFQYLQLGYFILFATVSILQAIADAKFAWLGFNFKKNFVAFLKFGFFTANCLARIYNIHSLVTTAKETSELLVKIEQVNSIGSSKDNGNSGRTKALAIGIGIISMYLIAFDTIFESVPFEKWTSEYSILDKSIDMSELLFVWSSRNYTNQLKDLIYQYGIELTVTTWTLGVVGKFVTYCGVLHGCMMLDLWPIIALQVTLLHSHFQAKMEETSKLSKETRKGRCPLSINWDYYLALRTVCDKTHHVFGKFLKVIHLQNDLLLGYYLLQILKSDGGISASLLVNTFGVIKVCMTYFFVQKSADKNEDYEECVIQCAERRPTIEMGGTVVSVVVLIKDMRRHPIGVGRGDFVVNEAFVLKLACFVGSLFVLLSDAESSEKNTTTMT